MKSPLLLLKISVLSFISLVLSCSAFSKVEHITVFESGKDGYHTFRIPSVVKAPNGDLLAICEGRKNSRSDRGDIDIVMRRSKDAGRTWSKDIQVIWDDGENTCGNPCAVVDEKTGTIWLLLTHNIGTDMEKDIIAGKSKGTRTVRVCNSTDNGKTWSKPIEITKSTKAPDWRWYATGPGVGIQIKEGPLAGRLVIPCDHSFSTESKEKGAGYGSHAIYSDDHGKTWQYGEPIQPMVNECQVVELFGEKGTLMMDMRSYAKRARRAQTLSQDGGKTWGTVRDAEELIEPVCQASILRWEMGGDDKPGWLLFSNPANEKKRVNMTVRASENNGRTWSRELLLSLGPSGYSCLVVLDKATAACFHETGDRSAYDKLVFTRFSKGDFNASR